MEQVREEQKRAALVLYIREDLERIPPQGIRVLRKKYRREVMQAIGFWLSIQLDEYQAIPNDVIDDILGAVQGTSAMTPEEQEYWRDQVLKSPYLVTHGNLFK